MLEKVQVMHRVCCTSGNAYDVSLALRSTFARSSRPVVPIGPRSTTNSASLRQPRETRQTRDGTRRAYSAASEGARNRKADTRTGNDAVDTGQRGQRLGFYEELLRSQESTSKQPREPKEKNLSEPRRHDWKTHMGALSVYLRENKIPQLTSEDGSIDQNKDFFDYHGYAIDLPGMTGPSSTPIPWIVPDGQERQDCNASTILDHEINRFAKHMKANFAEARARFSVKEKTERIINAVVGSENTHIKHFVFGSSSTGLTMPYSDLDIGLREKDGGDDMMDQKMHTIYRTMHNGKDFHCVVHRPGLHPIITAQHRATGIDVQIVAKSRISAQDHCVRDYLTKIPNLRALYAVVRTMFGIRGFVDPYVGGVSAYGTFMMLVAALTRRGTPTHVHDSPATQLLHFLSFWSTFDTTKYGMSLLPIQTTVPKGTLADARAILKSRPVPSSPPPNLAKPFKKLPSNGILFPNEPCEISHNGLIARAFQRRDFKIRYNTDFKVGRMRAGQYRIGRTRPYQPYLLCLQDPTNATNDLGATCHAWKHMQATMKTAYRDLKQSMEDYDAAREAGRAPESVESLLLPLVGRCHEVYAERRRRMVENVQVKDKKELLNKPKRQNIVMKWRSGDGDVDA